MNIKAHKLIGEGTRFVPSPNHGSPFKEGELDTVVIHYTAGGSVEGTVKALTDPDTHTSAHVIVGRDGAITQLVPFNVIAWHAGKSSYQGRHGFNRYALGIEIDNAGKLQKSGTHYVAWFGREYEESEVFEGTHRNQSEPAFWHRFTEAQISAVQSLCALLIHSYSIQYILGHEEIAPTRKEDPGPAFPLDKLRQLLLVQDRAEDGAAEECEDVPRPLGLGLVTASKLNIRESPYLTAPLAAAPLSKGTVVEVQQRRGDWYRVKVQQEGWVSAGYIKT